MATAPRATVSAFDAVDVAATPGAAAASMEVEGYARINGVLSAETASELLAAVNAELARRKAEAKEMDDLTTLKGFGDVLMKDNRYDLYLDLEPPVQQALNEVLGKLQPLFAEVLGEDAELFELSALISDPRSPRQPVHPDTPYRDGDGAAVLTAFVALQEVEEAMGPTGVIPRTHTKEAHERFNSRDDGGREKIALLRASPNHVGVLSTGDVNLIDSRLIHAGGANESSAPIHTPAILTSSGSPHPPRTTCSQSPLLAGHGLSYLPLLSCPLFLPALCSYLPSVPTCPLFLLDARPQTSAVCSSTYPSELRARGRHRAPYSTTFAALDAASTIWRNGRAPVRRGH